MGMPAISTVELRAAPGLGAKVTEAIDIPVPLPPVVTKESGSVIGYEQPDCVTTKIGTLPPLLDTDVDETLGSYVQPFTAGMLSWLSMNRVPKYFVAPDVKIRYAPPSAAPAGTCTSRA